MSNQIQLNLTINGMNCGSCASKIVAMLEAQTGVSSANINFATSSGKVQINPLSVSETQVKEWITELGYQAESTPPNRSTSREKSPTENSEKNKERKEMAQLVVAAVLCLPLLFGMVGMFTGNASWHVSPGLEWLLATPIQFILGYRFYHGAWQQLKRGSANMDTLVSIGTSAAYFYSVYIVLSMGEHAKGHLYFEASALIITLVSLGKWLELRAKRNATSAISELMNLRPDTALVWREEQWVSLDIEDVFLGDKVQIKAGEKIPADGQIVRGQTEVDESLLTGESEPVVKQVEDWVTAGSINTTGVIEVEVTALAENSRLSKIIELVENAQMGKAPFQQLVDKISCVFVPVVLFIATVTFVTWYWVTGDFEAALISSVTVLVIACPCALGLATPAALVAGTGSAAKRGILIRDIESLQKTHKIQHIAFDKTGTLTQGKPELVVFEAIGSDYDSALEKAASLQSVSEHPLAKAVLKKASERQIDPTQAQDVQVFPGEGLIGLYQGQQVALGNANLLARLGVDANEMESQVVSHKEAGYSLSYLVVDEVVQAILAFTDPLKPNAKLAIEALQNEGISCSILSGDQEVAVQKVAKTLNIDMAYAQLTPRQKLDKLSELRELYPNGVAMIGDGINDAPALAIADVSIAMGSGTDVAMETANITLMSSQPERIIDAVSVSKKTWSKIKQNLFWAFAFNTLGIPLAAFGYLSPALAGAAMAFSSIAVLLNSLSLKYWRGRHV
ncbi:copper-translocating P-type ATPase [Vibrio sp. T187]|uniref:heavy metal translocating P-type ATPase n=1 Tax=Vibrio TaxID=662 RepID=UPI0010C9778E|nr:MULTISPECIES: heavy metal translocating P-type ATPase [Vibrio]MBW3695361.1 copper-translocating P-type ATPase [Vibrio sp. T187]